MSPDKILEILTYTLPSIVTGVVAYYFFSKHLVSEEKQRYFELQKENQKHSFPVRLQAYERMLLFLERIHPNRLLLREHPTTNDKTQYLNKLIESIEQEFEHNLSQQIYMTDKCWDMIVAAKNASLQMLRNTTASTAINSAQELQEKVLKSGIKDIHPSVAAIKYLKTEVRNMF